MNALKIFCKAGLLLAVCCSAGCFGAASSTYVAKDVDVRGKPSKFEHRQKARSVEEAIARMLTDPTFDESYREVAELAKAAGRKKPVLAIKPIQNNTGDGKSDSAATHQIFKSLQASLRKTGKFEIVDYTQRQALIKTVIDGNNNGDDGGAIQPIGTYKSPNLILTGDIRRDETEDRGRKVYFHFLNLEIQSTATGTVFWNDTVEIAKQEPSRGRFGFRGR